ncbi:MAG TPA: YfiR family protein [Thermoanaerobaculia bacterium]|nr:YfiR family protein [Thermoanaerobaculia bacterium]
MALLKIARLLAFVLALGTTAVRAQVVAGEYQIKAAFLQNFPKFVEWPSLQEGGATPLVIGVVGDDPFGPMLAAMIHGVTSNGHPLALVHLHWNDRLTDCHILFISASEINHLPQILSGAPNALTVSDCASFARRGGIIELRKSGNRIRFDINIASARRAGLRISSKLLGLAMNVYDFGQGGAG